MSAMEGACPSSLQIFIVAQAGLVTACAEDGVGCHVTACGPSGGAARSDLILAGLETAIFGSEDQRLIH